MPIYLYKVQIQAKARCWTIVSWIQVGQTKKYRFKYKHKETCRNNY